MPRVRLVGHLQDISAAGERDRFRPVHEARAVVYFGGCGGGDGGRLVSALADCC